MVTHPFSSSRSSSCTSDRHTSMGLGHRQVQTVHAKSGHVFSLESCQGVAPKNSSDVFFQGHSVQTLLHHSQTPSPRRCTIANTSRLQPSFLPLSSSPHGPLACWPSSSSSSSSCCNIHGSSDQLPVSFLAAAGGFQPPHHPHMHQVLDSPPPTCNRFVSSEDDPAVGTTLLWSPSCYGRWCPPLQLPGQPAASQHAWPQHILAACLTSICTMPPHQGWLDSIPQQDLVVATALQCWGREGGGVASMHSKILLGALLSHLATMCKLQKSCFCCCSKPSSFLCPQC